jgi:hypothetical protein
MIELCTFMAMTWREICELIKGTSVLKPFRHECRLKGHPATDVSIASTFGWSLKGQKIMMENIYEFELTLERCLEKKVLFSGANTPLLTSLNNIKDWLGQFL